MELRQVCIEILKEAKEAKVRDLEDFNKVKMKVLNRIRYDKIPKNATIASLASEKEKRLYKDFLSMKPVRTISGVAPIALMTDPYPCPHTIKKMGPCTYCPGGPGSPFGDVPQSYTGKEPSTRRSIRNHYDPYLGVFNRLEQYVVMGLVPEKTDVIIQGGTFCFFPYIYQEYFVKYLLKAMNDFSKVFYGKKGVIKKRFNRFFEMPADIDDESRTERIQDKIMYIKNIDLRDDKKLREIIDLLFAKNVKETEKIIKEDKNKKKYYYDKKSGKIQEPTNNQPDINTSNDPNLASMKKLRDKVTSQNFSVINLKEVQKDNETAKIRCIGLTIETKSDYGKLLHGNQMLNLGCTRVEVGVQSVYEKVLKATDRGNTVKDNIESFRILKDLGFKINSHYMPGLPLTTKDMDVKGLKKLFDDQDYRPDMLKIYPCMVMKGTKLYDDWKKGKFKPITTKQAAEIISESKRYVPKWCRIMRVQRDIPTNMTSGGVDRTNLRQYVEKLCIEKNIKCNCIRCREAGIYLKKTKNLDLRSLEIVVTEYDASFGKEFFVEAKDSKKDVLFGFCRLRFPSQFLRAEITKDSALIREIHVFSEAVKIGETSKNSFQHKGIGKKVLFKSEEIARQNGKKKIVIISGIGAREYFKKFGYELEGPYMVKNIN